MGSLFVFIFWGCYRKRQLDASISDGEGLKVGRSFGGFMLAKVFLGQKVAQMGCLHQLGRGCALS